MNIHNQKVARFYNTFCFLYPLVDYFLMPLKHVLMKEINSLPNGSLLEIGVGNGNHFKLYRRHQVTGIDISVVMLAKARKKTGQNIELLVMDGQNLLFENQTFDYVVLSHVLSVSEDPEKLIHEIFRVLKPGGILLILNHFTSENLLGKIDRFLQPIAKSLSFQSFFCMEEISSFKKFDKVKEVTIGYFSYFKLIILKKHALPSDTSAIVA